MFATVGHEFNPGSSQQLGDVLFKELRLPTTKRTKTGFSTDASSLEALKELMDRGEADAVDPKAREVLDSVLEYRQLTKIKSTYVDALPALVNPARPAPHPLQPDRLGHGPSVQQRPQRAEHPGADGARQGGAQGVRGPGGAGVGAVRGGLLADRAPGAGARVSGPRGCWRRSATARTSTTPRRRPRSGCRWSVSTST